MTQCPVLEYVELLARTMDDYSKRKIGEKVYEATVKDIRQKIDKAVIEHCVIQEVSDELA